MKKLSIIIALFTWFFMSNIYAQANIVIPNIVREAFKKRFPNQIPVWAKVFGGEDSDQIRFEAKFKSNNSEGIAVYDNLGDIKAYEILIQKKDIPMDIIKYLNNQYKNYNLEEASEVKKDNKEITYEIGIVLNSKFYDAVFNKNGEFLKIIQKD